MSSYPATIATFREKQNLPGVTFVDPDKATIYADDLLKIEDEIGAIQTTLGTQPQGAAASVDERIYNVEVEVDLKQPALDFVPENVSNKDTGTSLGSSDTKYPSQKAVKTYTDAQVSSLQSQITALQNRREYAVGDIFLSFNSTDPATAKGYGTWVLRGQGKTLVGVDTSDSDFDTVKKTGGEKTHVLTTTEMPSHNHTQAGHSHSASYRGFVSASATHGHTRGETDALAVGASNASSERTQWASVSSSTPAINSTGGGGAHNNLQPYLTCYIWERTA